MMMNKQTYNLHSYKINSTKMKNNIKNSIRYNHEVQFTLCIIL